MNDVRNPRSNPPAGRGPAPLGPFRQAATARRPGPVREVWQEFRRSPRGMLGLGIFLVFLFLGLAAPWLTPYHPLEDQFLADRMARPAWMRYVSRYREAPVTVDLFLFDNWAVSVEENVETERSEQDGQNVLLVRPAGPGPARLVLEHRFEYRAKPPGTFFVQVPYGFSGGPGATATAGLWLSAPDGQEYALWTSRRLGNEVRWTTQRIDSRDMQLKMRLGFRPFANLASELLRVPGEYRLTLEVTFEGGREADAVFRLGESRLRIPGQLHGLMGTDHLGGDLWSQFVYGTRTSLMIGFVVAVIAVVVGTVVGIVSGYVGRWVDEVLMRLVDVFISIPFLPILIVLVAVTGKSLWNLVLVIGLFSWMSVARLVRSQTLTLRERAFVEAARAAGARPAYIMVTHILPNVLGLVFASLVLLVPSAIVAEATLSFLGFGDPRVPTWGRMLQNARGFGAFGELAWWWILPPGLALTVLAMAFVFIGNTLDDILNRRGKER
ncbi:MAG: ABC transporter permease [Firmicutes bacterium]|nr:ABC transporter permease [Bacillota bacterium]